MIEGNREGYFLKVNKGSNSIALVIKTFAVALVSVGTISQASSSLFARIPVRQ